MFHYHQKHTYVINNLYIIIAYEKVGGGSITEFHLYIRKTELNFKIFNIKC